MAQPVLMPKFGQTVEEASIVRWLKKEGDAIAKGDVLFEIETDKAVLEAESFHEGTLIKILVAEGETVPVQSTVAFLGEPGEAVPDVAPPPAPAKDKEEKPKEEASKKPSKPKPAPKAAAAPAAPTPVAAAPAPAAAQAQTAPPRQAISPRAKRLAKTSVIDYSPVKGTGPGGRVLERDVQAYLDRKGYAKLRITPAAKVLASQEELDVLKLDGSGEGGKILVNDVKRAIAEKPVEMSKMRQIIAQRLTESVTTAPHFFVTVSVDMTDLLALRKETKAQGLPYSVTDFVMQSVVLSLQEFKEVNSTTDGKTVAWHSKVHLGLAVALESGLVVPVIRNADDLTLIEMHDEAASLIGKARDGKLKPPEMMGSTFTISNMGMLNVENFTAIINPGEAAILAVSSTSEQAVVRDGKIEVRSIMKMTLSSDHRIIDGAGAANFINAIKNKLENTDLWRSLI